MTTLITAAKETRSAPDSIENISRFRLAQIPRLHPHTLTDTDKITSMTHAQDNNKIRDGNREALTDEVAS